MKEWNPEEMRRKFSREELIGHLQREYCMNLPWELDDALDYAQSVYPDITEKDLKNRQQPEEKPWQFSEEDFISQYCPMEGGNDYLGWIDDICKLLDGEAEPGDAASTGDYASMGEEELRKELKRLKRAVLKQAVDRYVDENY